MHPYAFHSLVPHSPIQRSMGIYWWVSFWLTLSNHLAQSLSLFKPFIIMLVQCLRSHLHFFLFKFYVFQLPAWWAQWLLWLLLTECSNVLTDIYKAFLLLFHCCIMLEIKLPTTANATTAAAAAAATTSTTTTTMYTIKDAGIRTLTQHLVVFRLKLHLQALPHLTGLNWFPILYRFVQFGPLLRPMQPGNSHYLLHMENISSRAVSGAVAPHIHWITSCSSTFLPHSWSLGLGTTGTGDRKCLQMTAFSVGHGSHASTGILPWYKVVWLHLTVPSADGCFSACKWFIHWTIHYFFILLKLFLARGMLPGNFCLTFEEKKTHSQGPT